MLRIKFSGGRQFSASKSASSPSAKTVDASALQEPSYTNAMRMVAVLRCTIPLIFAGISYQSIQIALHKTSSLGVLFLPISLGIVFIPVAYFLWKIFKEG